VRHYLNQTAAENFEHAARQSWLLLIKAQAAELKVIVHLLKGLIMH
jgi:hypothetical protein